MSIDGEPEGNEKQKLEATEEQKKRRKRRKIGRIEYAEDEVVVIIHPIN